MTKAILKNYRQSPRKVRLVADAVRGKKVSDAITTLRFMPKRAADPVKKLIESALANAKNNSVPTETLVVKEISVNEGPTLKRTMPRARGSANIIRKRTSLISVVLGNKSDLVEVVKEEVDKKPKAVKKTATKKVTKSPKLKTKN